MGLSWCTVGVNILHMSVSVHHTHVKAHSSCQTLARNEGCTQVVDLEREVLGIFSTASGTSRTLSAHLLRKKNKNVFPSMRQTLKDARLTHAGILSVSHLCANTLTFQHFHPNWSIKEPEPVRCDKKTSIWRSQKAPAESSLLLQHEMHCCDKRASWILTTQARLWDVFFQLPLNGLLPTCIQRHDGTR